MSHGTLDVAWRRDAMGARNVLWSPADGPTITAATHRALAGWSPCRPCFHFRAPRSACHPRMSLPRPLRGNSARLARMGRRQRRPAGYARRRPGVTVRSALASYPGHSCASLITALSHRTSAWCTGLLRLPLSHPRFPFAIRRSRAPARRPRETVALRLSIVKGVRQRCTKGTLGVPLPSARCDVRRACPGPQGRPSTVLARQHVPRETRRHPLPHSSAALSIRRFLPPARGLLATVALRLHLVPRAPATMPSSAALNVNRTPQCDAMCASVPGTPEASCGQRPCGRDPQHVPRETRRYPLPHSSASPFPVRRLPPASCPSSKQSPCGRADPKGPATIASRGPLDAARRRGANVRRAAP